LAYMSEGVAATEGKRNGVDLKDSRFFCQVFAVEMKDDVVRAASLHHYLLTNGILDSNQWTATGNRTSVSPPDITSKTTVKKVVDDINKLFARNSPISIVSYHGAVGVQLGEWKLGGKDVTPAAMSEDLFPIDIGWMWQASSACKTGGTYEGGLPTNADFSDGVI